MYLKKLIQNTILNVFTPPMKKSLFIFRQDLRVYDNRWFIKAIEESDEILPIFILDKNIISDFWWTQDKKFWFLREALEKLSEDIEKLSQQKLRIFYDFPEKIVPFLVEKYSIDTVYVNKSYSRYGAKKRDLSLREILHSMGKEFIQVPDYLLVEPEDIGQRKVFTPYFKLWQKKHKDTQELSPKPFKAITTEENFEPKDFIALPTHPFFTFEFGQKRFTSFLHENYNDLRNDLDRDGTSKLSVYIRFWIFSIRQIYNKSAHIESFVSELAWREFWQHIDYYFPECKEIEFQVTKRNISWETDENNIYFQKFIAGETGYPIVDACIKQLLTTNRMHGRWRMITASFLTKDLHIDWRLGEKFFKKHLLDYDENINFWNWQWSASVWADPKPIRIFNPILQSQKFDKETVFIKKYIKGLEKYEAFEIHDPITYHLSDYFPIIVDHNREQKIAKEMYKQSKEI